MACLRSCGGRHPGLPQIWNCLPPENKPTKNPPFSLPPSPTPSMLPPPHSTPPPACYPYVHGHASLLFTNYVLSCYLYSKPPPSHIYIMIIMSESSSSFFRRKYIEAGHFNYGRRPIQNINDHRRNHHLSGYRRRDGCRGGGRGWGGGRQWGSKSFLTEYRQVRWVLNKKRVLKLFSFAWRHNSVVSCLNVTSTQIIYSPEKQPSCSVFSKQLGWTTWADWQWPFSMCT